MLLAYSTPKLDAPGDSLLIELQEQQYMHPHRAVSDILDVAGDEVGFCREASHVAARLLGLDGSTKIGRLGKEDLVALSQTIRRLCCRPAATTYPASVA